LEGQTMGYFLLWLENLGLSLLLTATLLACIGRLQLPRVRLALRTAVVFVLTLVYIGLTCPAAVVELGQRPIKIGLLYPFLALTLCYGVGGIWLAISAMKRAEDDPEKVAAARWPRGKLAIALAATFCLHVLTFMNLDAAVQQRLVGVRAEASALALSVAPERVPDRDNAALVYNAAFESFGPSQELNKQWNELLQRFETQGKDFDPKEPEVAKFLDAHAGTLILLREAAKIPACSFDRDYGRPSVDMILPELHRIRQSVSLMAIDARHKAAVGDARGAIADVQAMFDVARHFNEEPLLIGLLVAISLDSRACATLESVLNTSPLSSEELEGVKIDAAFSSRRGLDRALRMEEAFGLWTLAGVGGQMPVRDAVQLVEMAGEKPNPWIPQFRLDSFYRVMLLSDDLEAYRQIMHQYRPQLTQNYQEMRERWQAVEKQISTNRTGMFASMLVPALSRTQDSAAQGEAQHRLAQVGLALHRYRAKHGRIPEKLDDLTTEFLSVVPRDPFDNQPLRYKLTDSGCVVYSIGRDLIDDGGKRLDQMKSGDLVFEVRIQKPE
jgi:hypothetical protein